MQVMALQPRVVGKNLALGHPVRRAAQGAGLASQHHRGESDPVAPQLAPQLWPVGFGRHKVPPAGLERAHFFRHAAAQPGIAGAERHHHGFRIFAEQAEEPALEPLLHASDLFSSTDLVLHRTAAAASGMIAAMAVTGW